MPGVFAKLSAWVDAPPLDQEGRADYRNGYRTPLTLSEAEVREILRMYASYEYLRDLRDPSRVLGQIRGVPWGPNSKPDWVKGDADGGGAEQPGDAPSNGAAATD